MRLKLPLICTAFIAALLLGNVGCTYKNYHDDDHDHDHHWEHEHDHWDHDHHD